MRPQSARDIRQIGIDDIATSISVFALKTITSDPHLCQKTPNEAIFYLIFDNHVSRKL